MSIHTVSQVEIAALAFPLFGGNGKGGWVLIKCMGKGIETILV